MYRRDLGVYGVPSQQGACIRRLMDAPTESSWLFYLRNSKPGAFHQNCKFINVIFHEV